MPDPLELMLADLLEKYTQREVSTKFTRLYDQDSRFMPVFSYLHEQLNEHFEAINGRAKTTRHYWAQPSRDLLALIDELAETLRCLKDLGVDVVLAPEYRSALDRCKPWLSPSGGSAVPEGFRPITILKYDPAFTRRDTAAPVSALPKNLPKLKPIGEGSYAKVHSYLDPNYGIRIAVKRAKKGSSARDLQRFRKEYDILKSLSFPYIVEVYLYDEERHEYKMEYCDATLREYIKRRNAHLGFGTRKRISLQFLYGIQYIYSQGLLHRDVSLQNVLMKIYAGGAVLVKLSDFGLVKETDSDFTRTSTDLRGTIRDPTLSRFKDYNILNEIYAVGHVLSYIFTGREHLQTGNEEVHRIIGKCIAHDPEQRYQHPLELIADVEKLAVKPTDAPA